MIRKGFTLIELLVVIIIVSILAAAAIPIVRGFTKRAILTEAVAALGMIRTLERAYYIEYGGYASFSSSSGISPLGIKLRDGAVGTGDLDGTYFSEECYVAQAIGAAREGFVVYCSTSPAVNEAPKELDTARLVGDAGALSIDQDGNIASYNIPGSGY